MEETTTIKQLRELLSKSMGDEMLESELVFNGIKIEYSKTIADYKIKENDIIHSIVLLYN